MIYFNINIRNPYWWERFEHIKCWTGKTPFKNKFWEVEIFKNENLLRLEFEATTMQDHAGINLELALFGYQLKFTLYDHRHWDIENNCWQN